MERGPSGVDCCICCDPFCRPGQQILTSCGHTFHRQCLSSWEKFSRNQTRCCPVCRSQNYQKVAIKHGHAAYVERCVILIQSHWRRCLAMRTFCSMWAVAPRPSHTMLQQKWLHNRLSQKSDNLINAMNDDGVGDLDTFFALLDQDIQSARNVYQEADTHLASSHTSEARSSLIVNPHPADDRPLCGCGETYNMVVDWKQVKHCMSSRGNEDCPICMLPLLKSRHAVGCSLLSCSHTFHTKCITSFEEFEFVRGGNPTCPICRHAYSRRDLVSA